MSNVYYRRESEKMSKSISKNQFLINNPKARKQTLYMRWVEFCEMKDDINVFIESHKGSMLTNHFEVNCYAP